ncbi:hypothetical protein B5C34_11365 [Pacificimonas flava]|uniref:Lipoprotein n=2 Tax=Pacificimonas TaxID=1960290 RepID=A0A219B6K9_9SPHN|nr:MULTISPECIES: hypothetical protein [Pacificimonas]MBZ6378734.1 hypothetical protein [Pacificimonas aurantium]OWV34000.1 hypothetical protein B5C34_11365 [Pacificimonas flava]
MRPLIAAIPAVLLFACDEAPKPTAASAPEVVDLADLPAAYRTPQAIVQAMATGQLFERPDRCEGFAFQNGPDGNSVDDWTRAARIVRARTGANRPAVITRIVAADETTGAVSTVSTPLGANAVPFRTDWEIRPAPGGDRIGCVQSVLIANAS